MAPVIGWILISGAIDKARNYTEVDAMVVGNAELCMPSYTDVATDSARAALEADPQWGVQPWGDCDAAAAYVASHSGFRVAKADRMLVQYISPADGNEHHSNLSSPVEPLPVGTTIKLHAHDRIAGKIKPS